MNERVKMILGTVQLGMEYGIGNTAGKPSYEEAFSLLDLRQFISVYFDFISLSFYSLE